MSEVQTQNKQNFTIIKTTPMDVVFNLHPISNPTIGRLVFLSQNRTKQPVPLDWALGVFQDPEVYALYQKKYFTFDDNEAIAKAAFEAGVYFDEELDFTPAKVDITNEIFAVLKSGNRASILEMIKNEGEDTVKDVAIAKANDLTQAVIRMLESIFNIQLTMDNE